MTSKAMPKSQKMQLQMFLKLVYISDLSPNFMMGRQLLLVISTKNYVKEKKKKKKISFPRLKNEN